ncbi:MAG TPA: hypothetical protein PL010_14885 [Flavobacteriales bacterium]|nr:hypothetical protein [Flavobacteriales bacterium]HNI05907.1 hypothetical protein [Flavobacteriales bacterium]HNK40467.1 hypothetical protein [Flavobacteriales bacterium]
MKQRRWKWENLAISTSAILLAPRGTARSQNLVTNGGLNPYP